MQVGIDVTCMYIDFGGHGLFGFGDISTFKNGQISLSTMDYSPWPSRNLINRNWPKKFMQVGIDVTCMYIDFGGCVFFGFWRYWYFQKRPNFPYSPCIVHGHQKI